MKRARDANQDDFLKVTDFFFFFFFMRGVQQCISAMTSDPSAYTARCSYRWLQLHKKNLVGRRTDNEINKDFQHEFLCFI